MLYVFTINVGDQMIIKMGFGGWPEKTLLFEYANQPAESAEGTTNITLSRLSSLQGNWALVLPTDVLPHLQRSSVWSKCKLVGHLNSPMTAFSDVKNFMAQQR